MSISSAIWDKLRRSKRYREEFVADHVKRSIPFQARALMEARGWNQQKLSKESGISQGQVSRAIDPSYGNLTLNTIIRLAAGFDVALLCRFVPFSELARWYSDLPAENFDIPSFADENEKFGLEFESAPPAASRSAESRIRGAFLPASEQGEHGGVLGSIPPNVRSISGQSRTNDLGRSAA